VTEFATYPSLRGQVAFVSGGATGLGAEFVAQLAGQGVRVGFVDVQDDAGNALAETLARNGHPEPLYQHCDVRDVAALQEAIAVTGERLGRGWRFESSSAHT
jgi:D-xylose 1-dehydrogenase